MLPSVRLDDHNCQFTGQGDVAALAVHAALIGRVWVAKREEDATPLGDELVPSHAEGASGKIQVQRQGSRGPGNRYDAEGTQ